MGGCWGRWAAGGRVATAYPATLLPSLPLCGERLLGQIAAGTELVGGHRLPDLEAALIGGGVLEHVLAPQGVVGVGLPGERLAKVRPGVPGVALELLHQTVPGEVRADFLRRLLEEAQRDVRGLGVVVVEGREVRR